MAQPPTQPGARRTLGRDDRRFLWLILAACWLALAAWAIHTFHPFRTSYVPKGPPENSGRYYTVAAVVPPLALRLDSGLTVRPGGVAVPADPGEAERAAARLRELAPEGADVYVEFDSGAPPEGESAAPASIWLPPPGTSRPLPFPYEKARLVAQVLVSEGLVRVDTTQPYLYQNELTLQEDEACRHHRGIWAAK